MGKAPAAASTVILKKGRAKPVLQRHPWIFSGAIQHVDGQPGDGEIVEVRDAGRNWLARGYFNARSQIRVRLLTWRQTEHIDPAFWRGRLERALAARRALGLGDSGPGDPHSTAYRLAHAESDYLPGLVVDRYGDWVVVQFLTAGAERHRQAILETLIDLLGQDGIRGVYERSDVAVREKEGLKERAGIVWGDEPPELLEILENNHRFLVDLRAGHKTGFYLDQRDNRARFARHCTDAEILDTFSYTGAFAVYATAGGASRATLVDSSGPSLELARRNIALNTTDRSAQVRDPGLLGQKRRYDYIEGDVFEVLRRFRSQGRTFDIIVLDPPKFVHAQRDVDRASRAYKDINLLGFELVRPGGLLFTFSCSGRVSEDLFQKIVFGALADTERRGQIIGRLAQGPDHPVALTFPEGAYLKGLVCRVW